MNTKFNEKDVPNWCRWIAVDNSGECFAYENKPIKTPKYFNAWYRKHTDIGGFKRLYCGVMPKNWKDELYTWG